MENLVPIILKLASEVALKGPSAKRNYVQTILGHIDERLVRQEVKYQIQVVNNILILKVDDLDKSIFELKFIFGINSISPVYKTYKSDYDLIKSKISECEEIINGKSFCLRAKRHISGFLSPTKMERELGGILAEKNKVNLTNPDVLINLEIFKEEAYLYYNKIEGAKGLPISSKDRALSLFSGGFDSPVASWMVLKRGMSLDYVYFNMGGEASKRQVLQIVKLLSDMWGFYWNPRIIIYDFKPAVEAIQKNAESSYGQLLLKRLMYKVADQTARFMKCKAFVTGESLGQVSSQSISNLGLIEKNIFNLVLRPLVALDKEEIIKIARNINTSFLSEKVNEFCSISKGQPVINPKPIKLMAEEEKINIDQLLENILSTKEEIDINKLNLKELQNDILFKEDLSEDYSYLDCQEKHMFRGWHAKDASHYEFEDLIKKFKKLDKKETYLVYCSYGTKSPVIAEVMQQNGFDAYAFRGNINKFKKQFLNISGSYE